jgi:heme-degrading monooxygenase HmoA
LEDNVYIRLINYHLKPAVTRADATPVYDEMHRLMQSLAGFRGLELLFNEDTHQAISLSYWKDRQSATDAGTAILPHLMERAQQYVDRPPEVSGYEMVSQEMRAVSPGEQ